MNIFTLDHFSLSFGERKIFDQCSFYLQEGEKVGVIGINGAGKSTLLKLIAGLEQADTGNYVLADNHIIRFLPQTPQFPEQETVLGAVLSGNILKEMSSDTIESEAKSMLTRLGVTDFEQPCSQLSGGQKKRLALVNALLSPAEILVLDEPTNHLDSEMSDWLENRLRKYRGAVVMVTHDRYFLDSVCTRIVEVDKGALYSYDANYAGYLELKMQREEMERSGAKKRANLLRNELAWVRRGAQARSTKQKARLKRFEELSLQKDPVGDGLVEISSLSSRLGKTTVELHALSKSYGDHTLIRDFTYLFLKNDRVGFVGPNGCGKSTLMKMIIGQETPSAGHIEIGQTVRISYYAQETDSSVMDPRQRVIDYIREEAEFVETPEGKVSAARMLEKFLFEGEDQYGLIGKLSGGERRRLHLCRILMGAPNVLILDEPTNDLDIATLQVLEDYLDRFSGIVIAVSHDRYFLDRIVRRIFAFEENGEIRQYEGGYTDYALRRAEEQNQCSKAASLPDGSDASASRKVQNQRSKAVSLPDGSDASEGAAPANHWKAGQKKKLKFTFQEQKDYNTIESEITALEEKIASLEADYLKYTHDFVKLNQIAAQKEEAEALLEQKMNRWMELEDLAARIANGETVDC